MDKYVVLQPIFDLDNTAPNDPSITPLQRFVLDKMRDLQNEVRETNKQIVEENKKIEDIHKKIDDLRFKMVNLDGQNQSFLDTLLKLQEANNA